MLKSLTFFLSFIFVVFVLVSVIRSLDDLEQRCGRSSSAARSSRPRAIVESRTGFNIFAHLDSSCPSYRSDRSVVARSQGPRSRLWPGSASDRARRRADDARTARRLRRGDFALALVDFTSRAAHPRLVRDLSRTSIVMLFVVLVFFVWLHPRETRRFWPLAVPICRRHALLLARDTRDAPSILLPERRHRATADASTKVAVNRSDPRPGATSLHALLASVRCSPSRASGRFSARATEQGSRTVRAQNTCVLDDQWLGNAARDRRRRPRCLVVADHRALSSRTMRVARGEMIRRELGCSARLGQPSCLVRRRDVLLRRLLVHPGRRSFSSSISGWVR